MYIYVHLILPCRSYICYWHVALSLLVPVCHSFYSTQCACVCGSHLYTCVSEVLLLFVHVYAALIFIHVYISSSICIYMHLILACRSYFCFHSHMRLLLLLVCAQTTEVLLLLVCAQTRTHGHTHMHTHMHRHRHRHRHKHRHRHTQSNTYICYWHVALSTLTHFTLSFYTWPSHRIASISTKFRFDTVSIPAQILFLHSFVLQVSQSCHSVYFDTVSTQFRHSLYVRSS